jgi:glycosyltransferase involved in cell wall biosynthesis
MKIIQIGDFPSKDLLVRGGIEVSVLGITQTLAKEHEVKVISFPNRSLKEDCSVSKNGFTVDYLCNPFRYRCLGFFRMKTYISIFKSFRPDVVHIHESTLLCLILMLYLRCKKINTVVTVHAVFYVETWKNFLRVKTPANFLKFLYYSIAEYFILLFGKKIIVDTQYVADKLSKVKKKTYHIIPQGTNDVYFGLKDEWDPMTILSVGEINYRKGYEYSIRAIHRLKNDFPNVQYYVIGTTALEERAKYYAFLRQLVQSLGLENNVHFLTDRSTEELIQRMKTCNLFILHSYEESQCIAICEAMAAGKPIVATQIGGIPCVVDNGVNGSLVPFGDTTAFYRSIREILANPELRTQMGAASRQMAERYSWTKIGKDVMAVYTL